MKVVIVDQARMTSTRLPGKIMKTVLGKPLLEYQIERLQRSREATELVIATTTNSTDDILADFCRAHGVGYYRGSESDVLSRYYEAAKAFGADIVVRVTSDCPVIDPAVVDEAVRYYLEHQADFDYVSNTQMRSYPRGMDAEVFPFRVLEQAFHEGKLKYEREHVTPFLYLHPERYRVGQVRFRVDASRHRWTVDTPEDFELVRRIIEALYPEDAQFGLEEILALLRLHPDWVQINAHVVQKKLGE